MALNKATQAALKALSFPELDIKKSYKLVRKFGKITSKRLRNPKNCRITTTSVSRDGYAIPVRIFAPVSGEDRGVVLFFHGGGWVNGDIDTYMGVCLDMQQELCRTVVSVDYRRAPEFKFPNATEDCYAVARQLFRGELLPGLLPEDIVILGDSAGGNLAAAVSLMARDRGEFLPVWQVLIYPSTGSDHSPESPYPSVRENGTDYLLTSKRVVGYMELYCRDAADLQNPYLAPILAEDLRRQPSTLIVTAQYCPLRDEGEAYGRRLLEAGNAVSVYRMPDGIHGYFSLPLKFKIVRKTYAVIRRFLGDDKVAESRPAGWTKLDNAAKIFPPTTTKNDARVFRFYCALTEPVDRRRLQAALNATLTSFSFYRSVLKKGIFWYYFEESKEEPVVREEYKEPCAQLYDSHQKGLLFEVTYFHNRINLEVYHALTDGEGAARFFQALVSAYLVRSHEGQLPELLTGTDDASIAEKKDDSFFRYYKKQKFSLRKDTKKSYHLRGERLTDPPLGVIEGEMSVPELLDKAHAYHSTVSVFLISVLLRAIYDSMTLRDRSKSVVITVPVDLRQYFASKSARNFFGIINVEYDFSQNSDRLEDITAAVGASMKASLEREKISESIGKMSNYENLFPVRMLPVFLKDPGLKLFNHMAEQGVTAAFSNLGRLSMPEELAPYIEKIGVMCSTNRLQACMCSYRDRFVITFTSRFTSADVQCRFFRSLVQLGIPVQITSNLGKDNNVIL